MLARISASTPAWPPQINRDGVFRYATSPWFLRALNLLAQSGVYGVAVDVWVSTGSGSATAEEAAAQAAAAQAAAAQAAAAAAAAAAQAPRA
jgi:hypothetical protein